MTPTPSSFIQQYFLVVVGILLVPAAFAVTMVATLFSSSHRERMKKRWIFNVLWCVGSIGALIYLAVLFAGMTATLNKARKVRTERIVTNIQTGIVSYETEYDIPPESKDNASLIKDLMSNNPRRIDFINLGPGYTNSQGEALDAWGTPLRINMTDPQHPKVQSAGPDRKWGTADDIGTVEPTGAK